jgi:hypothetical protein
MKKSRPKKGANAAIALPKPIELAKLAAILCSNAQPKTAMERALKFYVEAVCFLRELAEKPHALSAYLSVERQRELFIMPELRAGLAKEREDTLELDPQAESDPAREHLSKHHGLTMWKQGRTVRRRQLNGEFGNSRDASVHADDAKSRFPKRVATALRRRNSLRMAMQIGARARPCYRFRDCGPNSAQAEQNGETVSPISL